MPTTSKERRPPLYPVVYLAIGLKASADPTQQCPKIPRTPPRSRQIPNVGPGGTSFKDSNHFRLYPSERSSADAVLTMLEAAYSCFVGDLGWMMTEIPYGADSSTVTTFWKENIYEVSDLGSTADVQKSDANTGLSWLEVIPSSLADPMVTVHQTKYNQPTGDTMIELNKVIGDSFQVIVDATTRSENYYQAWPFFTYLTSNPDKFERLGSDAVRELFQ
ncbi:hypothetical protein BDV23DRAFT_181477 [Aspergillus alliaceus]|uniref:Uncharacterized protein n=1 Tax=Petromyces alliaceus TaxID=209559 RepID=A0A5N7CEG1_PETAA|nr:hypothetical protein BDV23DRAFT_181477 [Aspergillus alliaceus]